MKICSSEINRFFKILTQDVLIKKTIKVYKKAAEFMFMYLIQEDRGQFL